MAKKFNYEFNFHYILDGKEITEEEAIQHIMKKYPKIEEPREQK
jgi:hypothetical protein